MSLKQHSQLLQNYKKYIKITASYDSSTEILCFRTCLTDVCVSIISAASGGKRWRQLPGAPEPSWQSSVDTAPHCHSSIWMFPEDDERLTAHNKRWEYLLTEPRKALWKSIEYQHMCVCVLSLAGSVCNTTWDGWLCWDETEAGFTTEQSCPDYYHDFDPTGKFLQLRTDFWQCSNNKCNVVDLKLSWS